MSLNSPIEWTEATWNPVRGCSPVSPGCARCYAERTGGRFCKPGKPFHGFVQIGKNGVPGPHWTGKVELVEHMLDVPLRTKKPTTWFVNSMSDLFHEALPDEAIDRVFAVMALCPQHTFQVLTKRPERMQRYTLMRNEDHGNEAKRRLNNLMDFFPGLPTGRSFPRYVESWPLSNVWLGVSVEDRLRKSRIEHLRETPAAIRFLSLEPLLADLGTLDLRGIDWVIVGGESGPGARPMHPDWVRSIQRQCQAAGVPFFFKQWGAFAPHDAAPVRGQNNGAGCYILANGAFGVQGDYWDGRAAGMNRIRRKKAGRELDGRTWDEMPEVRT